MHGNNIAKEKSNSSSKIKIILMPKGMKENNNNIVAGNKPKNINADV
jgi:hypothetical protein